MLRWLIGTSLQMRYVVLGAAIGLLVLGSLQLRRAPVDVFPEFAPPIVQVQTEALGLAAEEVQDLITLNLEELLGGVPWLKSIRSESVAGLSSITMTFERGTDIMKARQMVAERLTLAYTLPNVAQPPVILQPVSAVSRIMMVGLSSSSIDPTELSLLARWTVKPRLLGVPGVANVAIWGQRLRQLHVQFDPNRLRDARVLQDEVIAAAGDALWVSPLSFLRASSPGTGGWIDNRNQRLGVQHEMPIVGPEDMARIALAPPHMLLGGRTMSLGDIAETSFSHPPLIGDAVLAEGSGLLLVIEKSPSANTLEVTRNVERALAELGRGLPGVALDPQIFRLADYVEDSTHNVALAAVGSALLMLVCLGALLADWRSAVVAIASTALSLVAALCVLLLAGGTINTMILAGLVVALVVIIDDVVAGSAALLERLRAPRDEHASFAALVLRSALETRAVAIYGVLIATLAVLPVFFLGGLTGAFLEPLARAYLLAILAATAVSITATPALCVVIGRPRRERAGTPAWTERLAWRHAALLQRISGATRASAFVTAALALAGLAVLPLLDQSLLPAFKEGHLIVNLAGPPGTSPLEMQRITSRMTHELRALRGVRSVGATVGRAISGDQVVGVNASQIWVAFDADADHGRTVAAVRETVEGYPGLAHHLQFYLRDKVSEALTGASKPLVVRIYGPRRDELRASAEEVRKAIADVPGIVDPHVEGEVEEPVLKVKLDLEAAGRANVRPGDVRRATATIFSGLTVGFLFRDQKIYDVVVQGTPEAQRGVASLRDLWIARADRQYVRLSDVAEVTLSSMPAVFRHEATAPYVDVLADIAGRDSGSVIDEVEDRLEKLHFPLEHHPEVLGEMSEWSAAQQRMLGVCLAAAIAIFLLLQACFDSWRLAAIAFASLPVSLAGGALAALVTGASLTLGSLIGFLALPVIGARHGIAVVMRYKRLSQGTNAGACPAPAVSAPVEALTPVLASCVTIFAAMCAFVAAGRGAGLEIIAPTATVIIGGTVASGVFALLAMPALLRGRAGPQRDEVTHSGALSASSEEESP